MRLWLSQSASEKSRELGGGGDEGRGGRKGCEPQGGALWSSLGQGPGGSRLCLCGVCRADCLGRSWPLRMHPDPLASLCGLQMGKLRQEPPRPRGSGRRCCNSPWSFIHSHPVQLSPALRLASPWWQLCGDASLVPSLTPPASPSCSGPSSPHHVLTELPGPQPHPRAFVQFIVFSFFFPSHLLATGAGRRQARVILQSETRDIKLPLSLSLPWRSGNSHVW